MDKKSAFQCQVEELLKKYIQRFLRYARFSHLSLPHRELLVGVLLYLIDDHDLVPDDIPNVGLLDDLAVFLIAARGFVKNGPGIPGVVIIDELIKDEAFLEQSKGMIYGGMNISLVDLRSKGRKPVYLPSLVSYIHENYTHLGRLEE